MKPKADLENDARPVRAGAGNAPDSLDESMASLNARLAKAEAALAQIPGKSNTEVTVDPESGVGIHRVNDAWRLVWIEWGLSKVVSVWDTCGLATRAAIAQHLPDLFRAIQDSVNSRTERVKAAHAALDEFESLLRAKKEGA